MTRVIAQFAIRIRIVLVLTGLLLLPTQSVFSGDETPSVTPAIAVGTPSPPSTRAALQLELNRIDHTLRQRLQQQVDLRFIETPLKDAMEYMATAHKIPIWIDHTALDDVGISAAEKVSFRRKSIRLHQGLAEILQLVHCTFHVRHGVLIVTAVDDDQDRLSTQVFAVFDLLLHHRHVSKSAPQMNVMGGSGLFSTPTSTGKVAQNQTTVLRQFGNQANGKLGATSIGQGGFPINARMDDSGDWLTDCIEQHTGGQWVNVEGTGGNLVLSGGVLVVYQTDEILQRVARLLVGLRRMTLGKQRPVEYDVDGTASATANDRVRQKLHEKLDVDFDQAPLDDVISFLEQRLSVPMRIDVDALEEEGLSTRFPITLHLKGATGSSVFRLALKPLGLGFYPAQGGLVITPLSQYNEHLSTVMFDLTDLGADLDDFADTLMNVMPGPWVDLEGEGGHISQPFPNVLVVSQNEHVLTDISGLLHEIRNTSNPVGGTKAAAKDPNQITTRFYPTPSEAIANQMVESLPVFVQPGLWSAYGNVAAIRAIGSTVVVRQRQDVQDDIAQFVDDMRFGRNSQTRPPRVRVSGRPQIMPQESTDEREP